MSIPEYEAKKIIRKYGIAAPKGALAMSVAQAREIALKLKPPFVIKAQVTVSGRGKSGGIIFADSVSQVEKAAEKLLNTYIKGMLVQSLLIEEKVQVRKELYFGVTIDRFNQSYVVIASVEGGIDIEEVAEKTPEKVIRFFVDPQQKFKPYHALQIAKKMGYSGSRLSMLGKVFYNLFKAGTDYDAELMEINPLAETFDGNFIALDARIILDYNALFRHPEYEKRILKDALSQQELEAARSGLAYVKLDGNIGVIGNGAGLVMATLDVIQSYGGKPANFLDVGGGASSVKMAEALKIVLSDPNMEVVLINILGGVTRCDEIARGIIEAKEKLGAKKPFIIRLMGTKEEEGKHMLAQAGMYVMDDMEEAAKLAVKMVKHDQRENEWA
ncbi:MAG: ADP-forming succinate--CoA ligase subunit beta [Candidatus Bathyarchaeia archaeon]